MYLKHDNTYSVLFLWLNFKWKSFMHRVHCRKCHYVVHHALSIYSEKKDIWELACV